VSEGKVGQETITRAEIVTDNSVNTGNYTALADVLGEVGRDTY
jgi:hypothetical protein